MTLISRELRQIRSIAADMVEPTAELAASICRIPAPTGDEANRARFAAQLLSERGYAADIDADGNVNARRGNRGGKALMLLAHTDTVFPAGTDLTVRRQGNEYFGPAIGDNSLGLAGMLATLDILDRMDYETATDIIAVANVGEEGLGNLRGAWAAMRRHADDVGAVIAVEGHNLGRITHIAVGSKRWKVTVRGPGGHSWGAFGQPSAIHGLGKIIAEIAEVAVPTDPRTTFNVGIVEGGTSVNTIAAEASALIDMRSIDEGALDDLSARIGRIIARVHYPELEVGIEVLGERPAGSTPVDDPLLGVASDVLRWLGMEPVYDASSTDANVPIAMGVPSICIGITTGGRVHTVDEFIHVPPIESGLAQLTRLSIEAADMLANASG